MSRSKYVEFGERGFWAYDVAVGIFFKHLIDAVEASGQAHTPFLNAAISLWRVQAAVSDIGLTLEKSWTQLQRKNITDFAEQACLMIATRESIPADEIVRWPLIGNYRIHTRGEKEVHTGPIVELGHAVIALVSGTLPEPPKSKAWFYGDPEGLTTIALESNPGDTSRE